MALSDQLMDLAGHLKRLEGGAATAHAQSVANMEEQRQQLRSKAAAAKGEAQARWSETTAKIEQLSAELKAKRERREGERAVEAATFYAEAAEEFATALNSLAGYVADEAAAATVDAGIAQQQAESVAKAAVSS